MFWSKDLLKLKLSFDLWYIVVNCLPYLLSLVCYVIVCFSRFFPPSPETLLIGNSGSTTPSASSQLDCSSAEFLTHFLIMIVYHTLYNYLSRRILYLFTYFTTFTPYLSNLEFLVGFFFNSKLVLFFFPPIYKDPTRKHCLSSRGPYDVNPALDSSSAAHYGERPDRTPTRLLKKPSKSMRTHLNFRNPPPQKKKTSGTRCEKFCNHLQMFF